MATQISHNQSANTMPKSIARKLNQLRRKLTSWILVHGFSRWLLVILAVLVLNMALDRFFKMDFAQRTIMLCLMGAGALAYFFYRVIRPLSSRPNDDALLYEVEDKNTELNQSLISGVQLAREKNLAAQGTSPELAQATIDHGIEQAGKVNFGSALDASKAQQNWLLLFAGLILAGLLGYGVMQTDFLRTWFNRNILLSDDQWPQQTYLEIVGVEDGLMKVPRGSDHRQLVHIVEESQIKDVEVTLELDTPSGRTLHRMKPTGKLDGREKVFVFHNVSSEFRFRASGGDATTPWAEIKLVEPPAIVEQKLEALLPEYTGMTSLPLVGTGPHSVLVGSQLKVGITANKPLKSAVVKNGDDEYPMTQIGDDKLNFAVQLPGDGSVLKGGQYEFALTDETGLASTRRSKFEITIKDDKPPKVRASLLGISGLVVPRARLPVSYNAADEYGLTQMEFDCNWKSGDDDSAVVSRLLPFVDTKDENGKFLPTMQSVHAWELEDLKLTPGTSFRFAVKATDNRPEEPGTGRSQEFLLRIVSVEELRADLLRREVEQRKAFQQAYDAQLELSAELRAISAMRREGQSVADFDAGREARLIGLTRDQKSIGTSLDRIANRFEEFLVEVDNNKLDEKVEELDMGVSISTRFDQGISGPIRRLDADLISLASRNLDNCRRAASNQSQLAPAVDKTVEVQQRVLDEMKKILDSMVQSEGFQELVNGLLEIQKEQENVKKAALEQSKPKNIFDGDGKKGIFDKKK